MAGKTQYTTRDIAATIRGIGTAAQRAQKDAVYDATRYAVNHIESRMYKDLGGKDYFRNMHRGQVLDSGTSRQRLWLRWNVKGEYNPTSLITAQGPWGLLEYGAERHAMIPRLNVRRRQKGMTKLQKRQDNARIAFGGRGAFSGVRPLGNRRSGFGPVYRVNHPGTKGKQTFAKGLAEATPQATKIAMSLIQNRVIREARRSGFGSGGTETYIVGEPGSYTPFKGNAGMEFEKYKDINQWLH